LCKIIPDPGLPIPLYSIGGRGWVGGEWENGRLGRWGDWGDGEMGRWGDWERCIVY